MMVPFQSSYYEEIIQSFISIHYKKQFINDIQPPVLQPPVLQPPVLQPGFQTTIGSPSAILNHFIHNQPTKIILKSKFI
jgi:hypothetical protein